jgi:hypothetical protein
MTRRTAYRYCVNKQTNKCCNNRTNGETQANTSLEIFDETFEHKLNSIYLLSLKLISPAGRGNGRRSELRDSTRTSESLDSEAVSLLMNNGTAVRYDRAA